MAIGVSPIFHGQNLFLALAWLHCSTKPILMKKYLNKSLLTAFGVLTLVLTLSYCSSDSELKPQAKSINIDNMMVDRSYVAAFKTKYEAFIGGLSTDQKASWQDYISAEEAKIESAKVNVGATCNCGAGMSSCSASGAFSDCCVCWNPQTQTGACGVYFGLAICKNENNTPPPQAKASAPKQLIKFYPNRFSKMLDDMDAAGIKTNSIRQELETLVGHAEAE